MNECLPRTESKQAAPISQRWFRIALLLLSLAACGGPQQDAAQIVRVGSLSAPGTPWHDEWLRFEAAFDSQPDAGLALNLFITGQLGSEETVLSNLRRGRVQLGGFSLHGLASVVPELSVLLAPYLFDSRAEVDFVMDNYLTEIFTTLFAEQGIALLRWSEVGWNHVFCRDPVIVPADIRGLKMRASSAIGPQEFARRVGADNVPVSYAELITALQTGLLDCGQGGVGLYALGGIAQEAPHLALTYHIFDTGLVVANQAWLNGLTEMQRQTILSSLEPTEVGRAKLRAALAQIQSEQLGGLGVVVHELDPAQRAEWQTASLGSHAAVVEETGGRAQEVYDLIITGKRDFQSRQASNAGGQ